MRYPQCNISLPIDANFCPSCGLQVNNAATGATQRLDPAQPTAVYGTLAEGICPKCRCTEIYVDQRGLLTVGGGYAVLNTYQLRNNVGATMNIYLCSRCGFVELFMADAKFLPDIVRTWRRI